MLKKILIYGLGTFFSKVLVFFMIPIYTRFFSPGDYGYYDVIISNMQMVISISFIEIWSGIIRFMFEYKDRYKPVKIFLVLCPVFLILYIISIFILSKTIEIKYLWGTVFFGISYLLFNVGSSICRGLEKNTDYVISGMICSVVSCTLGCVAAVRYNYNISYLITSQALGYLISSIYIEFRTKAYINALKSDARIHEFKEMIYFCFPLMLNAFGYTFLETYNKNVLLRLFGEEAAGFYALALKFSAIASILISIYSLAWQEEAFIKSKDKNRSQIYTYHINQYMKFVGFAIPVYIAISFYAAPYIGGKNFLNTQKFIPLAIISVFISSVSGVLSTIIAVQKNTIHLLLSTMAGAAINICLMTIFPYYFFEQASSFSLCIAYLFIVFWRYCVSKKGCSISINLKICVGIVLELLITSLICLSQSKFMIMLILIIEIDIWIYINRIAIKNLMERVSWRK